MTKSDNFKRLSGMRMDKLMKQLDVFSNLSNANNYEYTETEIDSLFAELQAKVDNTRACFKRGGKYK